MVKMIAPKIRQIDKIGLNLNQAIAITISEIASPRIIDTNPVASDTNPPKIGIKFVILQL